MKQSKLGLLKSKLNAPRPHVELAGPVVGVAAAVHGVVRRARPNFQRGRGNGRGVEVEGARAPVCAQEIVGADAAGPAIGLRVGRARHERQHQPEANVLGCRRD